MSGNERVCAIEGCETPVRSRGWCRSHYEKWRRSGHPLGVEAVGRKPHPRHEGDKRCRICGVTKSPDEFYKTHLGTIHSYCKDCHRQVNQANRVRQARENPKPARVPKVRPPCAFPGCTNKSKAKGLLTQDSTNKVELCGSHWNQQNIGRDCTPLRPRHLSYISDKVRQCTACEAIKPAEAFYSRTDGTKQSQCKVCQGKVTRYYLLRREGRLEEAQIVAESMPERLRNRVQGSRPKAINTGNLNDKTEGESHEQGGSDCHVGEATDAGQ